MIKNRLMLIMFGLLLVLSAFIYFQNKKVQEYKNSWSVSENNYKAANGINIEYKLTVEQLEASLDSLDKKLLLASKDLGLKKSKIKSMMIIIDSLSKKDTIQINDTIFVENFKLDTIIGDRWVNTKMSLAYPNKISFETKVYNERNIFWSNKRESINPRSKVFFIRWFQKKQTVVEIKIKDLNPYLKVSEFKYNTIIK